MRDKPASHSRANCRHFTLVKAISGQTSALSRKISVFMANDFSSGLTTVNRIAKYGERLIQKTVVRK